MPTLILVRHGRSRANATGTLAGRQPGVDLDATGRRQADAVGERLAELDLADVVTSPIRRCRQTAAAIVARRTGAARASVEKGLTECDYGEWQGRAIKDLAKEDLWRTVQQQPSAVIFPGGESMRAMQDRAVAAVRRQDARIAAEHGPGAVWVAVSHGDVIKSILADALGTHLDLFQRIHVDPASVSVVRYTDTRPIVLGVNTHQGSLAWLQAPAAASQEQSGDVPPGGGAGPGPTTDEVLR